MINKRILHNIENKKMVIILVIITILMVVFIGTYAWFTWSSTNNTELTLTIGELADVSFNTGNDINVSNIGPVLNYLNDGEVTTFSIRNKSEAELLTNINLNITNLPEKLKEESFKYILLSSTDNVNFGEVTSGSFVDKSVGNLSLVNEETTSLGTTYYKFIIYIDGNMENPTDMMGKSFSGTLSVDVSTLIPEPNSPDLLDGLIPIMYKGSSWVKADEVNADDNYKWYDYDNQMWANAVLVSDSSRSMYESASIGTIINENDVLAYYVWIPRYKYKLFNAEKVAGVDSYNARATGIDIVFESGTTSTGTVSCTVANDGTESCTGAINGEYYTHPAFTFGNIELKGIWVGKFELTGSTTTPKITPNVTSLRNINVSTISTAIAKISASSNTYGINSSEADSHMMKNVEWGAVAYFSNSKYGRCPNDACTEIGINNNSSYITGCGATPGSSENSSCNSYTTSTGMLASTTGNIYGIYDMSGGAYEYVMGNIVSNDGSTMMSGNSMSANSGYNGMVNLDGSYTKYNGGIDYPDSKYYDRYQFNLSILVNGLGHLGDATSEVVVSGTTSWNSDQAAIANSITPWVQRGGCYNNGSTAGAFYLGSYDGNALGYYSGRAVLVHN